MKLVTNFVELIGKPSMMRPLPTYRELKKDQQIDGWKVPYNMHADWEAIFWFFGLWVSSYGICKNGKKHRSVTRGVTQALTRDPIFVGDYVDGLQVTMANNTFNPRRNLYDVVLEFGIPPLPRSVEQTDFAYLLAIYNHNKQQQESTVKLIEDFFNKVLPLVLTIDGKKLDTSAAKSMFSSITKDYNSATDDTLKELKEKEWHF